VSASKDVRALIREITTKEAKNNGWTADRLKGHTHYTIRRNGIRVATIAHSPSDYHAVANARADLRRGGFEFARK
jgi:hypothetical protein